MEEKKLLERIQRGLKYSKPFTKVEGSDEPTADYQNRYNHYNSEIYHDKDTTVFLEPAISICELTVDNEQNYISFNNEGINRFDCIKRIDGGDTSIVYYTLNPFPSLYSHNTYKNQFYDGYEFCEFYHEIKIDLYERKDEIKNLRINTEGSFYISSIIEEFKYSMITDRMKLIELLNEQKELIKKIGRNQNFAILHTRELFDNNIEISRLIASVTKTVEDLGPASNAKRLVLQK